MSKHPNKMPFEGVLTFVDQISQLAPSGARGHRVRLPRSVAADALSSLRGKAVDYTPMWDGHDSRRKFGVITRARLDGDALRVYGHLFAKDYPEATRDLLARDDFGMSWEIKDAHVEDLRADVWTLTRVTFVGAAILLRSKAAYRNTTFRVRKDSYVWTPKASRSSSVVASSV